MVVTTEIKGRVIQEEEEEEVWNSDGGEEQQCKGAAVRAGSRCSRERLGLTEGELACCHAAELPDGLWIDY